MHDRRSFPVADATQHHYRYHHHYHINAPSLSLPFPLLITDRVRGKPDQSCGFQRKQVTTSNAIAVAANIGYNKTQVLDDRQQATSCCNKITFIFTLLNVKNFGTTS
ncbi:unnamed protein product, partial [Ceratitis capitata]